MLVQKLQEVSWRDKPTALNTIKSRNQVQLKLNLMLSLVVSPTGIWKEFTNE